MSSNFPGVSAQTVPVTGSESEKRSPNIPTVVTLEAVQSAIMKISGGDIRESLNDEATARRVYDQLHVTQIVSREDGKQQLRNLCERGQELGRIANNSRTIISGLKEALQTRDPDSGDAIDSATKLLAQVETERIKYDSAVSELRTLREEIERMKAYLKESHSREVAHFHTWLTETRNMLLTDPG
jgi:hypothetical protein